MEEMYCPVGCGWVISPLIPTDPMTPFDVVDSYATQHSLMSRHLQEEHKAQIGGRR